MLLGVSFVHWLVILGSILGIFGSSSYVIGTLKGTLKPNRVSWLMWSVAPMIGTIAALSAHADPWATVRTFLAGFFPFMIFLSSFVNPKSYWKLTFFDFLCGAFSVFAVILWLTLDSPELAILFAIIGDGFALLPTVRKAWSHPETESGFLFLLGLISTALVLPSILEWNVVNSAFQIYLLFANTVILFALYRNHLGFSKTKS